VAAVAVPLIVEWQMVLLVDVQEALCVLLLQAHFLLIAIQLVQPVLLVLVGLADLMAALVLLV
jgi:hypothetical protein